MKAVLGPSRQQVRGKWWAAQQWARDRLQATLRTQIAIKLTRSLPLISSLILRTEMVITLRTATRTLRVVRRMTTKPAATEQASTVLE